MFPKNCIIHTNPLLHYYIITKEINFIREIKKVITSFYQTIHGLEPSTSDNKNARYSDCVFYVNTFTKTTLNKQTYRYVLDFRQTNSTPKFSYRRACLKLQIGHLRPKLWILSATRPIRVNIIYNIWIFILYLNNDLFKKII